MVELDLMLLLLGTIIVEIHACIRCLLHRQRCINSIAAIIVGAEFGCLVLARVGLKLASHSSGLGICHVLAAKVAVSFLMLLRIARVARRGRLITLLAVCLIVEKGWVHLSHIICHLLLDLGQTPLCRRRGHWVIWFQISREVGLIYLRDVAPIAIVVLVGRIFSIKRSHSDSFIGEGRGIKTLEAFNCGTVIIWPARNSITFGRREHILIWSSLGPLWWVFKSHGWLICGELLGPVNALITIGNLIRELSLLGLLIVYVATFLTNLIVVRRSKGACICRTVSLQFTIHSDLSVAWLVYVWSARLFINETDHTSVALHIRVEFGTICLAILRVIHAVFFGLLDVAIVTNCLITCFSALSRRLWIDSCLFFGHYILNLLV